MAEKMFEVAVRNKMRFPFKGIISVEDLWDLSVENLDIIYKALSSQLKAASEESLLNTKTAADKELDIKIEIVKYIFNVKLEERNAKLKEKERRDQKQKIAEILASKQDQALQSKSVEELTEMLKNLD